MVMTEKTLYERVFGGLTASRKILLVQALPAAAALALVFLSE